MSVETLEPDFSNMPLIDEAMLLNEEPLNGTDARRRLEDKMDELRLIKELREFDFDL